MAVKTEAQPGSNFDIEALSRVWLTNYLNPPNKTKYLDPSNKELRAAALDYAIRTTRIEGIRSHLRNKKNISDSGWDILRNLDSHNENIIADIRKIYGEKSQLFRLYSASIAVLERYASKIENEYRVSRAAAFRKIGVIFRHQKEVVLADLQESAIDPDLG